MHIVVPAGGIGAARFLRGLRAAVPDADVTVIGNTADDITLFGLRVCPDLDTVMYTLGGGLHEEQGWGRADETYVLRDEFALYGVGPAWFGLGDRDLATHVVRSQMLTAGYPLSDVTAALCRRWEPGVTLLPMSDDRVETHVVIDDPEAPGGRRAVHFQEYWVRLHAAPTAHEIVPVGAEDATAGTDARIRTQYSWKCTALRSPSTSTATCVSTRSSVMGISRTPGFHRSHSASVTALSG
jgi:LPPG:FO 2-phospho-L-lactate transferase